MPATERRQSALVGRTLGMGGIGLCVTACACSMLATSAAFVTLPAASPLGCGIRGAASAHQLRRGGVTGLRAVCSGEEGAGLGRREALALALGVVPLLGAPGLASAAKDKKAVEDDAARLIRQMNIVKFTATIDDATNKALKMAENGDLRGAEKQWTLAIDVYENGGDGVVLSPQALYRLGKTLAQRADCRADLGTLEKSEVKLLGAVDDYAKAIDIQSSPEMKVKLGTILTLLGRFAEGDKELDAVIDGNVGNEIKGRAYTNRGISKQRQQLWVDAVKDFTEASELTKGNDEVLKNLALAKIEAGDAKGALIMLRDQAKKIPKGTYIEGAEDVPAALAAAEFVAGNADKARAALDKVTDIRFRDLRFVREARFWGPRLSKGLEAALAAPKTAPQPKASSAKSAKPVASPPAGAPKTPAAPAPPAPEAEAAESVEAPAAAAL